MHSTKSKKRASAKAAQKSAVRVIRSRNHSVPDPENRDCRVKILEEGIVDGWLTSGYQSTTPRRCRRGPQRTKPVCRNCFMAGSHRLGPRSDRGQQRCPADSHSAVKASGQSVIGKEACSPSHATKQWSAGPCAGTSGDRLRTNHRARRPMAERLDSTSCP